jgi:hypothetical protein
MYLGRFSTFEILCLELSDVPVRAVKHAGRRARLSVFRHCSRRIDEERSSWPRGGCNNVARGKAASEEVADLGVGWVLWGRCIRIHSDYHVL